MTDSCIINYFALIYDNGLVPHYCRKLLVLTKCEREEKERERERAIKKVKAILCILKVVVRPLPDQPDHLRWHFSCCSFYSCTDRWYMSAGCYRPFEPTYKNATCYLICVVFILNIETIY